MRICYGLTSLKAGPGTMELPMEVPFEAGHTKRARAGHAKQRPGTFNLHGGVFLQPRQPRGFWFVSSRNRSLTILERRIAAVSVSVGAAPCPK